jgi:TPP-dependent trihydroxycyclohexane-1,2-dione (THcHDO) dehydratase
MHLSVGKRSEASLTEAKKAVDADPSNAAARIALATALDDAEGTITKLQRDKELGESNYKRFVENLEQSRIDEKLGAGKVSNISTIQAPSPPGRAASKVRQMMGMVLFASIAAGSMPGDLHKLWRTRDPKGYHVEYGYSCMGYEIAGGLGVKLAAPEREVYVMVGDGSYLMLSSEIVTSIQEGLKLTIVLVDNHGFSSIGNLSRSLGTDGFGTQYRYRRNGSLGLDSDSSPAPLLPVDLAANAESLGAKVIRCGNVEELRRGLEAAKGEDSTVVLAIEGRENDRGKQQPSDLLEARSAGRPRRSA